MKTVKIGIPLLSFSKKPIIDPTKDGVDKTVYLRDILIQAVGQLFQAENKQRAIAAFRLGQKLYDCDTEEIALEDAEFDLIMSAIETPRQGMSPIVLGQVYLMLDEAKKDE